MNHICFNHLLLQNFPPLGTAKPELFRLVWSIRITYNSLDELYCRDAHH